MLLADVAVGMDMSFSDLVRAPKVELPGGARQWVDDSLRLLIEHFGTGPLRRPAVVPGEFGPAGYDGSEAAARELCLLVAERMGIPPGRIRFSFRLEKVVEAGQLLGATLADAFVTRSLPAFRGAEPADIAAVRKPLDRSDLLPSRGRASARIHRGDARFRRTRGSDRSDGRCVA